MKKFLAKKYAKKKLNDSLDSQMKSKFLEVAASLKDKKKLIKNIYYTGIGRQIEGDFK
jgi:hypothetical protein